jgi:hypothetical protein
MEAKALVSGKSANFALGGAIIASGIIGWMGYSAASAAFDWGSPYTVQDVTRQLLRERASNDVVQTNAPMIAPQQASKLPEPVVFSYPATVVQPDTPKQAAEQPKPEDQARVVKRGETVIPPHEKQKPDLAKKPDQKPVVSAPPDNGGWIDDLMPGEADKTQKKGTAFVVQTHEHKGKTVHSYEISTATRDEAHIAEGIRLGLVKRDDSFKSDPDLWSDK